MPDIKINDFRGLKEIDVLGLMYDYKKIVSTSIPESFVRNLKNTFVKYGLKYDTVDESFDFRGQSKTYLISKETKYLKAAKRAYKLGRLDLVGRYLGYPECCVKFYYEKLKFSLSNSLLRDIYYNSNSFSWRLNNLLNFEGRTGGIKDLNLFREFTSFFKKTQAISLISHSPCSYDCRQSLKIAYLNHQYLLPYHRLPLSGYLILKNPVFYIDDFHFAIFEGYSGKNSIEYSKLLTRLGVRQFKDYLLRGDRIKIDNNSATVFRGNRILGKISSHKKILILPFDKSI